MFVQPVQLRGRHGTGDEGEMDLEGKDEDLVDGLPQLGETASGACGDRERSAMEFRVREDVRASRDLFLRKLVDFREHRDDGVRWDVREEGAGCEPDLPPD